MCKKKNTINSKCKEETNKSRNEEVKVEIRECIICVGMRPLLHYTIFIYVHCTHECVGIYYGMGEKKTGPPRDPPDTRKNVPIQFVNQATK